MHHITIRDQVCNVMASLTKTFFVRPEIVLQNLEAITACRLSHSCCMPFSMVGSTGTVLQNDESAPCKRAVPARSTSGSPPRSRSAGSSGSYVVGSHPGIGHSAMRMFGSWHCVLTASMRNSPWSRLANGSLSPCAKLLYSLLTLFFTHLWWPWWSPRCSSPGNS